MSYDSANHSLFSVLSFRLVARRPAAVLLAAILMMCANAALAQTQPPIVTGSASPENIKAGEGRVTFTWGSSGADSCEFNNAPLPTSGTVQGGPYTKGEHSATFSCSNSAGTTSHTIRWTAWGPPTLDSFALSATTTDEK